MEEIKRNQRVNAPNGLAMRMAKALFTSGLCFSIFVHGATWAQAEGEAPRTITCAVIPDEALGFHESAVFSLLQVQLSNHPDIALLERAEIDRILEEQAFQLAFTPAAGHNRRNLGALLKANLLILLRAREVNDRKILEAVVAETEQGLRLLRKELLWTEEDPDRTVESILAIINHALEKVRVEQQTVIAVPPFAAANIAGHYTPVEKAYAGILQEILQSRPGVVLLEVEEAQALASELSISGDASISRRLMPYRIQGSYRIEGWEEEKRVNIRMELVQGENILFSTAGEAFPPNNVPSFLREAASELIRGIGQAGKMPPNSVSDSLGLYKRGVELGQIGQTESAAGLIEAALLIRPEFLAFHKPAFLYYMDGVKKSFDPRRRMEYDESAVESGFRYALSALDHLEKYIYSIYPRSVPELFVLTNNECDNLFGNYRGSFWPGQPPAGRNDSIGEFLDRRREIFARYLEHVHVADFLRGEAFNELCRSFVNVNSMVDDLSSPEVVFDAAYRVLAVLDSRPGSVHHSFQVIHQAISRKNVSGNDLAAFLERLSGLPGKETQIALQTAILFNESQHDEYLLDRLISLQVELEGSDIPKGILHNYLRQKIKLARKETPQEIAPSPTPVATVVQLASSSAPLSSKYAVFRPLLNLLPSGGRFLQDHIIGWLPCGDGIDAVWTHRVLFLMKRKGELEEAFSFEDAGEYPIDQVIYDGRFLWALSKGEEAKAVIVNPKDGMTDSISRSDGLPPATQALRGISLREGKIFAAGFADHTWLAIISHQNGAKEIDIIHEARTTRGEENDPESAFSPRTIQVLRSENPSGLPILAIERSLPTGLARKLLVVDLKSRQVKVGEAGMQSNRGDAAGIQPDSAEAHRLALEGKEEYSLRCEINGITYAIGQGAVWDLDSMKDAGGPSKLRGRIPSLRGKVYSVRKVFHSNHYGPIYQLDDMIFKFDVKERGSR